MNPSLHVQTWGNPDHPPLVLLHGFMGQAGDWEVVAGELVADHYILAFDLPGHGASIDLPDADYQYARAVELISGGLHHHLNRPCTLLGYSMGARLALGVAAAHPEQVGALVMESGSPGLVSDAERQERVRADQVRALTLREQGVAAFLDTWYDQALFASLGRHPGLQKALVEKRLNNHADALARAVTGLGVANQPNYRSALPGIKRPLLVLAGELDAKYVELAREIHALHPQCRLEIFAGTGHNIHLENPRAFVKALSNFNREIENE